LSAISDLVVHGSLYCSNNLEGFWFFLYYDIKFKWISIKVFNENINENTNENEISDLKNELITSPTIKEIIIVHNNYLIVNQLFCN